MTKRNKNKKNKKTQELEKLTASLHASVGFSNDVGFVEYCYDEDAGVFLLTNAGLWEDKEGAVPPKVAEPLVVAGGCPTAEETYPPMCSECTLKYLQARWAGFFEREASIPCWTACGDREVDDD